MPFALHLASLADVPSLLPRMRALNELEAIAIPAESLELALRRLIDTPELGAAWLIQDDQVTVGYAVITMSFDLEFGGRDAFLTELFVDDAHRGRGVGGAALELLRGEMIAREVRALHIVVRPEERLLQFYERSGFVRSPRVFLTRVIT